MAPTQISGYATAIVFLKVAQAVANVLKVL